MSVSQKNFSSLKKILHSVKIFQTIEKYLHTYNKKKPSSTCLLQNTFESSASIVKLCNLSHQLDYLLAPFVYVILQLLRFDNNGLETTTRKIVYKKFTSIYNNSCT